MFDEQAHKDVCQKIAVLDILYKDILDQENNELSKKLSVFKAENVQWVLNKLHQTFQRLDEVLEMEESKYLDY